MSLLQGKRLLVTGVLTDDSIAYGVADLAQREGAQIVLTNFGRGLSLTKRVAKHLPVPPDVLELDVTVPEHLAAVVADLEQRWGAVDGVLHSIGFAPQSCLGGGFLAAPWEDVRVALEILGFLPQVPFRRPVASFAGRRGRFGRCPRLRCRRRLAGL